MKQKTLLFTLLGAFSCLVFSSYDDGPYHSGLLNRTGNAGGGSCDGGGCHSANNANTKVNVTLIDVASSTATNFYTAGKTYTVAITGSNASASLTKFGFQLAAVKESSTTAQAGTLTAIAPSTAIRTTSGSLQILEHTAPIAASGRGPVIYSTTATWVAPAAGTGNVKFFLTLNAVNGNSATSGDQPNNGSFTFGEAPLDVANMSLLDAVKVYPNPATTAVNIAQEKAANGVWNINAFDRYGRKVYAEQVNVSNGNLSHGLNTANWARGIYTIQLSTGNEQKALPIVLQ